MTPRPFFSTLAATVYMCLGGLLATAVLAPQLHAANAHVGRLVRNERTLVARCVIRVDGSVESCEPGTVFVNKIKGAHHAR